jgi:hypothetical protein
MGDGTTAGRGPELPPLYPLTWVFSGGGERIRTADFHVANVALCQLSYTPGVHPG